MSNDGWIGVDLDGTLAFYDRWDGSIGLPVPEMANRVKDWLGAGKEVRIVTARANAYEVENAEYLNWFYSPAPNPRKLELYERDVKPVEDWCERHFGVRLKVTSMKDYQMIELWDDRAVQVEVNTGRRVDGKESAN